MTGPLRLQLFFDMTRTVQSGGRMAGAVRVESEFASALLDAQPDALVPIAWSSSAGHFVELDRETARSYARAEGAGGDVTGPPVEASRVVDATVRRVLLVTGAGWLSSMALLYGLLRLRRALEAELQVVVHDLVHLRYPHWAPRDEALRGASAHEAILSTADRVLAYSDSTIADIAAARSHVTGRVADVAKFALGTVMETASPSPDGLNEFGYRPFALYVSSVATRKNHAFIAEVWSRLAVELGAALPRLLFVGRPAADQKDALERLMRNPALEEHLIHVSGASDEQLAWLYQHCLFTVFPSLYEGWGLPVAESLAFGKVCLASNASSIPEVAGGVTPLLDPLDIVGWCDAVRRLVTDRDALAAAEARVRQEYRPVTWSEAATGLWAAVLPPATRGAPPMLAPTDTPIALDVLTATRQAWRPVRDTLGRVVAHRARAGALIDDLPSHGLRLSIAMRNDAAGAVRVETTVNGSALDGCAVRGGDHVTRTVDLPRDTLLLRGLLEIVTTCRSGQQAPALALTTIAARPLSAAEEAAAIETRRGAWLLDEPVGFGVGSRALGALGDGWDEPARWGVWTVKPTATLQFRPMPQPSDPIVLTALVRGFVPAAQPSLEVEVMVNNTRLMTWTFRHPADFSFVERAVTIPPELISDGWVRVTFAIPGARSPQELGMSADERPLGLGLAQARVATAPDVCHR
jgi:glycosyltransferase involved in cell wall biosynthesis